VYHFEFILCAIVFSSVFYVCYLYLISRLSEFISVFRK